MLDWYEAQPTKALRISVISLSELYRGALRLPVGRRRSRLEGGYRATLLRYAGRVLPVDLAVAEAWAEVNTRHHALGRKQSTPDELIAATAIAHDLTVVTRNIDDFEHSGRRLLSPWSA